MASGGFSFGGSTAATGNTGNFSFGAAPATGGQQLKTSPTASTGLNTMAAPTSSGAFSFGTQPAQSSTTTPSATPAATFGANIPSTPAAAPPSAPSTGGVSMNSSATPSAPPLNINSNQNNNTNTSKAVSFGLGGGGGGGGFGNQSVPEPMAPVAAPNIGGGAKPVANAPVVPGPMAAVAAPNIGGGAKPVANAPVANNVIAVQQQQRTIHPDMQSQTIAEIADKWIKMLNAQTQTFKKSCQEVKEWDDFLLAMHHDLNIYSKHTTRQIQELDELNNSLDSMKQVHEQIHQELTGTLKDVQQKLHEVSENNATAADKERQKNYEMAEDVNGRVTQLTDQLRVVVKKLNDVQDRRGSKSKMSHIETIEQIVDKHLRSLEQIDQKTEEIANSLSTTQSIASSALQMRN